MKATVCELPDNWTETDLYWERLIRHLESECSDLLVLPEMPFFTWITRSDRVDPDLWLTAVKAHDAWMGRLDELPVEAVILSRPVVENGLRLNRGMIHTRGKGARAVHDKFFLPDEPGYYEASWYHRGDGSFAVADHNGIRIGFLICTELWFTDKARHYSRQGMDILVCPRATPESETDIWVTGGRAAAIVAGAYCLSSNYNGPNTPAENFGGTGWVIHPERGKVMALTSADKAFVTLDMDVQAARAAKATYPRYVKD